MNQVLARWNLLNDAEAAREALPCCGSKAWASELTAKRPIADETSLIDASTTTWWSLTEDDWKEAFNSHPRIGQKHAGSHATAKSLQWSTQEQEVAISNDVVRHTLSEANYLYEQKFGRIFIVCATGKSSAEILTLLETRMRNDDVTELREAAEQQNRITHLRLKKWLQGS